MFFFFFQAEDGIRDLRNVHADVDIWNPEAPCRAFEVVALEVAIDTTEDHMRILDEVVNLLPIPLHGFNFLPWPDCKNGAPGNLNLWPESFNIVFCCANQQIEV